MCFHFPCCLYSPTTRTPSPLDHSRRRAPNLDDSVLYVRGDNSLHAQADMGTGSVPSRAQLGSRPHTPVGRVDIRPQDDPAMLPHTFYYAPASPKLEFKSTPTTPVTERWQKVCAIVNIWITFPTMMKDIEK